MNNKPGFSLVELLIATFIASILGALLFTALYQVNRFVPRIDNTSLVYEKAALLNTQLERDISGVTAPNEYYYRLPEPEKKGKKDSDLKQDSAKKKSEAEKKQAAEQAPEEKEKKSQKPLERVFYSTNKDGNLNQLSFISTNPLQVYWSAKAGSAKPRVARVLYTLKEEKGSPKSYVLVRQESPNLEFESITRTGKEAAPEFVLADGIKSLTVEYTYIVPEKKESAPESPATTSSEKKEPKKKEIKKSIEWVRATPSPQAAPASAQPKPEQQIPLVPNMAELKIALWDTQKKRNTPFVFKFAIPSHVPEKRETEDVSQKLLGTLREFFTQGFGQPQPTTKLTNTMRPNTNFLSGKPRR